MTISCLLLLLLSTIIYAQLSIPDVCYNQTVINGTACCINLQSQCEPDSETYFNCTYGPAETIQTNILYLSMSKCGLTGTIPVGIIKFPYLMRFDLSFNYLEGTIPEQIGEIGKNGLGLEYFDLSNNELEGAIPKTIGEDPKGTLKHLDMSNNKFIKANLPTITELSVVEYLDLSHNDIAENFHESFGELQALRVLNFGDNRFGGSIPYTMGQLTELRVLNIERNSMSGTLPKELSQIQDLQTLNISDNKFTGAIPSEWGTDWRGERLEYLNLGDNEFNCPVRDYSTWAKQSDFIQSYGEKGETNCHSDNNSGTSKGLDGVEVAIIVIAVIIVLAVGIYCWHGKHQANVKKQVAMLHDEDVFDD